MNMHPFSLAIVFALAGAALPACSSGVLTEQSARAVVETSEAAWKLPNVDRVETYNSRDCIIHATSSKPDGTVETESKACQKAIDDTRSGRAALALNGGTYTYESTHPTITINGDRATARLRATVSLFQGDKSFVGVSDQVETLQVREGRVQITAVDIKATSVTVNGKRVF